MNRRSIIRDIIATFTVGSLCLVQITYADIVEFSLQGAVDGGITAANEPSDPATDLGNGSGDLLSVSSYDTDTNVLSLNVGWGSGNGFTDLTSNASLVNLHFVADGVPPDVFSQSGDDFLTLDVDQSPSSGGFEGFLNITEERETDLLEGRVYLHIHTDVNSGGEARGYFVATAVPEPSSVALLGLMAFGLAVRRNGRG